MNFLPLTSTGKDDLFRLLKIVSFKNYKYSVIYTHMHTHLTLPDVKAHIKTHDNQIKSPLEKT